MDEVNRWTLIQSKVSKKNRRWHGLFKCMCGTKKLVNEQNVRRNLSKSCGCLQEEVRGQPQKTHGMTNTNIYKRWSGMLTRCYNNKSTSYEIYGGRGIVVCERWLNFENYFEDMGHPPTKFHTIDRINNNGNYEPDNCRWATRKQQRRNQRPHRIKRTS